jgi:F0F1-type ATP synthase assembly protein I
MAACVLIGIWIGKALDAIAGTSPLLLFVFMIFGVMAAFKSMFSIITKDWKKEHEHF